MAGSKNVWKLCDVRGYHAYRDVWDPYIYFKTKHQKHNPHDKYAVAAQPVDMKDKVVVWHFPKEISNKFCLFIHHGGAPLHDNFNCLCFLYGHDVA